MPRRRKDCPICGKRNLVKLSNHLADTHQLSGETRRYYLSKVKPLGDQNLSEDMSSRKRMRDDWNDGMLTVSHDEESEEEVSGPKRMRSESDNETSTESNGDISSSSDEGESPEEMNDSDEEADPWGVLIHEAAAELRTKHNELVQSFENNGFSEIDAKKQAFSEILPELRKELGNIYLVRLQWMSEMKRDPVHRKIVKTKDAFVDEDEFDLDEALAAAVSKRKFLLERMLEGRQHFSDEEDDDQDNACISYESRNELH